MKAAAPRPSKIAATGELSWPSAGLSVLVVAGVVTGPSAVT
jgi:hypothetical protein